jgi:lipopolysaccharide export system permease protein
MQIIHRYVIREMLRFFLIVFAAAMTIYLVVDFFEKIDDIVEAGVSLADTLMFFMFKVPLIISHVTPVGVLLSVLIVFGLMARNNELMVLQSSGISSRDLTKPLLLLGLIFSVVLFFFSEIIVPMSLAKANDIWQLKVDRRVATFKQENIWIKGHRAIYHIAYFNPATETISGVSLYKFDDEFNIAMRLDAESGTYTDRGWLLEDCLEQIRLEDGNYKITHASQRRIQIDLDPESLKNVVKKSEEMSFKELATYIQKVKDEGYDVTPYEVDWQAKLAFPSVCFVMILAGTAIALRQKKGEGLGMGITYGIGTAFAYWIIYSFCISLGHHGILKPLVSAWLTNVLFVFSGLVLLLHVD